MICSDYDVFLGFNPVEHFFLNVCEGYCYKEKYKDLLMTTVMYTLCTKCTQYLQDMQDAV